MKQQETPFRRRIAVFAVSLSFYLLTLVFGAIQGVPDVLQAWRGFYTLVLPRETDSSIVKARLEKAGISDVVALGSAGIDVGWYTEIRRFSLADLDKIPKALRLDSPLFETLPRLFSDESSKWQLVYIPWRDTAETLKQKLNLILDKSELEWEILELNSNARILLLAIAVLAVIVLIPGARSYRWALLGAGIPWIFLSAGLGPSLFPFQILALFMMSLFTARLSPFLERYVHEHAPSHFFWELVHKPAKAFEHLAKMKNTNRDEPIRWHALAYFIIAVLITTIAAFEVGPRGLYTELLLLFLVWPSIWIWSVYLHDIRRKKLEHRPFLPIAMLRQDSGKRKQHIFYQIPLLLVLSAGVQFLSAYANTNVAVSGLRVPVPVERSPVLSLAELEKLYAKVGNNPRLPDLSMLVAHRASMELYPLSSASKPLQYGFPKPGLEFKQVQVDSDTFVANEKTIFSFDDAWLDSYRRNILTASPDSLLFSQGTARLAYSAKHGVYSTNLWGSVGLGLVVIAGLSLLVIRRRKSLTRIF